MPSSEELKRTVCPDCRGTGQPGGIKGGPRHGLCSTCRGRGHVVEAHPAPTAADTPGHSEELRKSLQSVADELSKRPPELRGPFKMPSRAAADTPEGPTQREEWLAGQATLDRHRVLVLEKRIAELERYRTAIVAMRDRDDRNGSLPVAYREIIDAALTPLPEGGK